MVLKCKNAYSTASIRVAMLVLIASVLSAVFTFVFVVPYSPVSRRMADPQSHEELESSASIPDNPLSLHDPHEIHHEGEAEEANRLAQKVRVLCWVMTMPASHDKKAVHVKATWGKRCNKLIFISSKNNESLGAIDVGVEEGRNMLWGKTKAAYKYVYDHHLQEYDWFLKADDDTYVIMENLRYMLSSYDPKYPIYFGSRFKPFTKQGYMSGGGGYVLSREATRKFVEEALPDDKKCKSSPHGAEDAEIGKCLDKIGVMAGDSRDSLGRGRFFPFTPGTHLMGGIPGWYKAYAFYSPYVGLDCCSDTAISFHYVNTARMYELEYMLYHVRPYGIQHKDPFPAPLAPDSASIPREVLEQAGRVAPSSSDQKEEKSA
ncbi:glycoprotein-N-acetylgalactosamine 3-beta-galactosyltransferase 1-like isoform X1 [Penaeus japonicus]|uniref:glycoprotein-N-acetylgalactosamine 3-beta-galactosyltransferase 1-like isoform X1 n=1 Tax=Penaeus japonicus TaxID=27405 RepID=UPI001C70BCF0|nr:glycoprotein-N-acetylgalactosamine 3-beta-galactosyltransferase 1-like isoform X1 [Penaeus japonicus]